MSSNEQAEKAAQGNRPEPESNQGQIGEGQKEQDASNTSHEHDESRPRTERKYVVRDYIQYFTLCFNLFVVGWNDGTTGPLLPRIQGYYHVNYAVVSLIWVLFAIGALSGALMNIHLNDWLGHGKVMAYASLLPILGFALQVPVLPFPVFVLAYLINGVGLALVDALSSSYVVLLQRNPATKMSVLHTFYGFGNFVSSLVATQFSQIEHWNYHYIVSEGLGVLNAVLLISIFRLKPIDETLLRIGQQPLRIQQDTAVKFRQILTHKTVHGLAMALFLYVGVSFTISGWIVTYLQQLRGGGANSGYVNSGFTGGLVVGRLVLLRLNKKIGERRSILIYMIISVALQLVVWLVPSFVAAAVGVAFIGFFQAPIYPLVMNEAGRLLPKSILIGSIVWIGAMAFAGSAVFPFVNGALANKFGISVLQPLLVAILGFMIIVWIVIPRGTNT